MGDRRLSDQSEHAMAPQPFMIRLAPEDLEQLDALVRARQLEQPQDIATRAAVIRDLIRTAYTRGTDHEQPPTRQTSR